MQYSKEKCKEKINLVPRARRKARKALGTKLGKNSSLCYSSCAN